VNYMVAKDSVKKRLETGISFTEFSYQLVQAYDYLHLYQHKNCKLQMGGSDQWGNITTGTELIRRKTGGEAFALTYPLITKADGGKFGKTEKGNIWLDARYTSPYHFYQFWVNCSDEDTVRYIKIFSLFGVEEIQQLIDEHRQAPHLRLLQKSLAKDITCRVHGEQEFLAAVAASEILFGAGTAQSLKSLPEEIFLEVFDGVPMFVVSKDELHRGIEIIDFLAVSTTISQSKSDARRMLKEGSIAVNKEKVQEGVVINASHLINNRYLLVQKGKKNYFIVNAL